MGVAMGNWDSDLLGTLWGTVSHLSSREAGLFIHQLLLSIISLKALFLAVFLSTLPHSENALNWRVFRACRAKLSTSWSWWMLRGYRESANSIYYIWKQSALVSSLMGSLSQLTVVLVTLDNWHSLRSWKQDFLPLPSLWHCWVKATFQQWKCTFGLV